MTDQDQYHQKIQEIESELEKWVKIGRANPDQRDEALRHIQELKAQEKALRDQHKSQYQTGPRSERGQREHGHEPHKPGI